MIQSTQRKMLRLIIQTKRKYKKTEKQDIVPKKENGEVDINEMCSTDERPNDAKNVAESCVWQSGRQSFQAPTLPSSESILNRFRTLCSPL